MWSLAIPMAIILAIVIFTLAGVMTSHNGENTAGLIFLVILLFFTIIVACVGWVGRKENIPPKQDPLSAKIVNVTRTNNVVLVTYLYGKEKDDKVIQKAGVIKEESAKLFNSSDNKLHVKRKIVNSLYGDNISDDFELITYQ